MKTITLKTWYIADVGWPAYFAEVAALSRGRMDVAIRCKCAGVISLVEVPPVVEEQGE